MKKQMARRCMMKLAGAVLGLALPFASQGRMPNVAQAPPAIRSADAGPIRLHPDNPHYFLFQGRPTILLTSAEHYGGVLNLDFDYVPYFQALKAAGGNYTRIFSGAYRELPGSFNILRNTLAPAPGRYACPWARSNQASYALGGNKFDLSQWDPAYFARLKDFVKQAGRHGVVVELSLFCPFYAQRQGDVDVLWKASPLNTANNINGVGTCARTKTHTLDNGNLLAAQEAMTRKIVEELNGFDNLFYEICNEAYAENAVREEWEAHIARVITDTEKALPKRHLIAQNIANLYAKIGHLNPQVSIVNFHYAEARSVTANLGLQRVLGDDETGFRGPGSEPYRVEAWRFLMAGGGLYNNLDYTFTTASPEGRDTTNKAPGSTTTEIRDQLAILRDFFNAMDFVKMRPVPPGSFQAPTGIAAHALALGDKLVVAYFAREAVKSGKPITPESGSAKDAKAGAEASLELAGGPWMAAWISPLTGKTEKQERFTHAGGRRTLRLPTFGRDVVLRLTRP